MTDYREFYRVVKFLKEKLNFDHPVVIRRSILNNNDGECRFYHNRFIIKVDKKLPEYYATEVLIHEVAHVLAWGMDKDFHGKNWGIAYSKVYRLYLEYLIKRDDFCTSHCSDSPVN
jgi:hypothetical protein